MRMAELSQQSGVPVATIKYYLRENLLPPGQLTSRNQATYSDGHVRRLRLIRALIDIGHVPVASVKSILDALDAPETPLPRRIGAVHRAVSRTQTRPTDESLRSQAAKDVQEMLARRRWRVDSDTPAVNALVEALAAVYALGQGYLYDDLDSYAAAIEKLAELEVAAATNHPDSDQIAEGVVIGTVLGESVVAALRLMAQESVAIEMLAPKPDA